MSYKFILLLCLCLCCYAKAQDTICKRTGECFAAKVMEIGLKEIRFKRADNPDGPLFIYNKSEVKRIRYASGAVDTFAVMSRDAAQAPVYAKKGLPGFDHSSYKIEPAARSCTFYYRGGTLSDRGLIRLARNGNERWQDNAVAKEIQKSRESKTFQYIAGFGGIGIGVICLDGFFLYALGGNTQASVGALVIGATLVVTSEILSIRFKVHRDMHSRRLAALYNAHLDQ